jgi:L-alanine-DL-glutamate epimerase-like enolase superfamily enzyme
VSIRRIDVVPWTIPLRAPLETARGAIRERRGFLVVVEDHAGHRGVGEAAPHPATPPFALQRTRTALGALQRICIGGDPARLLGALSCDDAAASNGIDVALHDLVARAAGVPVYALLGGLQRARIAASTLDSAAPGFTCAKIKIGPDPATAIARVAAVRAAAPALTLRADANGAWDVTTAVRVARQLRAFDLEWLEQPLAPDDVAGLRRVRAAGVRLAADESVHGEADVARLAGVVDAIVVKLVQVGGLAAAVRVAEAAEQQNLGVTVTTSIDTAVGTAAALHLAAALPMPLRACGIATGALLSADVAVETIADGPWMRPPSGPGLGITIDAARLERVGEAA